MMTMRWLSIAENHNTGNVVTFISKNNMFELIALIVNECKSAMNAKLCNTL